MEPRSPCRTPCKAKLGPCEWFPGYPYIASVVYVLKALDDLSRNVTSANSSQDHLEYSSLHSQVAAVLTHPRGYNVTPTLSQVLSHQGSGNCRHNNTNYSNMSLWHTRTSIGAPSGMCDTALPEAIKSTLNRSISQTCNYTHPTYNLSLNTSIEDQRNVRSSRQ